MGKTVEQLLGVLTGAVGDWLDATGNALATPLTLTYADQPLPLTTEALQAAYPDAGPRIVLLIHGLMATEHGFAMGSPHTDFGTVLRDKKGLTPLRLRYNSGLAASQTGRDLAILLEALLAVWPTPVEELVLVCHSMGGLLVRAASGYGESEGHAWCQKVTHVAYLGTPHLGAPLEGAGRSMTAALRNLPDPVAQLIGMVGDFRSEGIQQLGDPSDLPWPRHGNQMFVASSLVAGTRLEALVGDGMVSLRSALAADPAHPRPEGARTQVLQGLHHAQLAFSPQVAELLLAWLPEPPAVTAPAPQLRTPAPGAVPPSPQPSRVRSFVKLGLAGAKAGHRAVAQIRLARADQALAVVKAVAPRAAAPVRAAHALHAGLVAMEHAAIDVGLATASAVVTATDKTSEKR